MLVIFFWYITQLNRASALNPQSIPFDRGHETIFSRRQALKILSIDKKKTSEKNLKNKWKNND